MRQSDAEYQRRWRLAHPERRRKQQQAWRLKHRDEIRQRARTRYVADAPRLRSMARIRYSINRERIQAQGQALKQEIVIAYGGRCVCCGEDRLVFLTIDHINNDGAEHRRAIKSDGGRSFYYWLRSNHFPPGFQCLCMNCNWAKRYGLCPHLVL